MIELTAYIGDEPTPFTAWYAGLDDPAAERVTSALDKMRRGLVSGLKSVGAGVMECRVDFGPGYRIYLGRDGDSLVILLGGGSKKTQRRDITAAKRLWDVYKRHKREGV